MRRWSRKFETNILRLARLASPADIVAGTNWYSSAHESASLLARRYHLALETVVGVIAVLSPGAEWNRNLSDAEIAISSFLVGDPIPVIGVYGTRNVSKARAILSGTAFEEVVSPITSPKVTAFYYAILDPTSATVPVIDQHLVAAMNWARGDRGGSAWKTLSVRDRLYPWYARHVSRVAEREGFSPIVLQAILWVTWKRLKEMETA